MPPKRGIKSGSMQKESDKQLREKRERDEKKRLEKERLEEERLMKEENERLDNAAKQLNQLAEGIGILHQQVVNSTGQKSRSVPAKKYSSTMDQSRVKPRDLSDYDSRWNEGSGEKEASSSTGLKGLEENARALASNAQGLKEGAKRGKTRGRSFLSCCAGPPSANMKSKYKKTRKGKKTKRKKNKYKKTKRNNKKKTKKR